MNPSQQHHRMQPVRRRGTVRTPLRPRIGAVALIWALVFILNPAMVRAQFQSGSTGINGVFPPVAPPAGTTEMVLDLRDGTLTFLPDGSSTIIPNTPGNGFADGILQVVSFNLPAEVTMRVIRNRANTPFTVLSQQLIRIDGTLVLSGENGGNGGFNGNAGGGQGGPGGFKGGNGGLLGSAPRAGTGLGPGGGPGGQQISFRGGSGGSFATQGTRGGNNNLISPPPYGQLSLLPLLGGSGGGGGPAHQDTGRVGGGGGGGGGATLLTTPTVVEINGAIIADGGAGGTQGGGGGSGGGIRVIAETVRGSGLLSAVGGAGAPAVGGVSSNGGTGGLGRIRMEGTFINDFTGTVRGFRTTSGPGIVMLPTVPSVRIVRVAGTSVPEEVTGGLGGTDVVVPQPGPAEVVVAASNVPIGTTISITVKPETDGEVVGPVISPGLEGTFEASTTTVIVTFPTPGLFFVEARATFTIAANP